uniref:Uncharacterized protein n=1 Tax=Lotharella globosa TaxID=91324 RepID=A0A7S3ZA64_9EUKA|mmetsp:Transcript_22619/g.45454  ORF Transcript_22619/g.45454 Transcript_22619/m.45454 type:complete len:122 (+) Transcript_22619:30-395(+)
MGASPCLPERCAGACPAGTSVGVIPCQPSPETQPKHEALDTALDAAEEQLRAAEGRIEQKNLSSAEMARMATELARVASLLKDAHQRRRPRSPHRAAALSKPLTLNYAGTSVVRRSKPREA